MLILKQCYNKPFRQVPVLMPLMLILLMDFQAHYTIALQKVMFIFFYVNVQNKTPIFKFCNT